MSALEIFQYGPNEVRTVQISGDTWFIAQDVAKVLELSNTSVAVSRLDADEVAKFNLGGLSGEAVVVNESGLYSLILGSRKPEAKAFKRWVTHEVLPAIRKTGSYGAPVLSKEQRVLEVMQILQADALAAEQRAVRAEKGLEAAKPAVEYVQRFVADEDVVTVKVAASYFDLSDQELRERLVSAGLIYAKKLVRWSNSQGKKVTENEWHAYANWLHIFDERPQHNAPRHHNGQVRTTLYIRQAKIPDMAQALGLTLQEQLGVVA